jgi:hypothetical protein
VFLKEINISHTEPIKELTVSCIANPFQGQLYTQTNVVTNPIRTTNTPILWESRKYDETPYMKNVIIIDAKKLIETNKCISPISSGKKPIRPKLIPDNIKDIFHRECIRKKLRYDIKNPKIITRNPFNINPMLNNQDIDGFSSELPKSLKALSKILNHGE